MTIRHVIYTQVPGVDGTGITTIEKEQLLLDVEDAKQMAENVGTDTPGETADQLRVSVSGPRWLPPDTVSPLLFGAAADGTTDDYAAIMQAVDKKKTIMLGGNRYRSNSTINLSGGIIVDGGGMGAADGIGKVGEIQFPMDIDGIVVTNAGANSPVFRDVTISTTHPIAVPTAGAGHGLTIKAQAARLDGVYIHGFRGNGIQVLGGTGHGGVNANLGVATNVKSYYNGGHGIYMNGDDANAWAWIVPNVGVNGGYGIYNDALYHNAFYSAHAISNVAGDYYDDGWGSYWANPYAEMGGAFFVGGNSQDVQVYMGGNGSPTFSNVGINEASSRGWIIVRNGTPLTHPRLRGGWEWRTGGIGAGSLDLRSPDDDLNLIRMGKGGGTGSISFFGKIPVAQPSARPDTSGATLTQLEAEVNSLKAKLRALGLMAT